MLTISKCLLKSKVGLILAWYVFGIKLVLVESNDQHEAKLIIMYYPTSFFLLAPFDFYGFHILKF